MINPIPRRLYLYPQGLRKKQEEGKYQKLLSMLKELTVNIPLVEALKQMPGYAKFRRI